MATFRPAVKEDDGYIQKIIKYIPAEIIAGYTALTGYLSTTDNTVPPYYTNYYLFVLIALLFITPIWTYYAVLDNNTVADPEECRKRAFFQALIAMLAFLIWVFAVGNPLLKIILCRYDCGLYSTALGSIILVLFTILTPLLERIILGSALQN